MLEPWQRGLVFLHPTHRYDSLPLPPTCFLGGKMGKMSPAVPVRDSLVSVRDQIPAVSNHPGPFPKVCASLEEQRVQLQPQF